MSSYRLVVRSSKIRIPSDFQTLNNNSNKGRHFEIIEETLLSHSNTSNGKKIYFARGSNCKLLLKGYGDDILTVNHEETDTKLICSVKHAIEDEENSKDATFIIRSTLGDIDIPVILPNRETNSNVFIDNGRGNNPLLHKLPNNTQIIVYYCYNSNSRSKESHCWIVRFRWY